MIREPRGTCQPSGTCWAPEPSPIHGLQKCLESWAQAANLPSKKTTPTPRSKHLSPVSLQMPTVSWLRCYMCTFKTTGSRKQESHTLSLSFLPSAALCELDINSNRAAGSLPPRKPPTGPTPYSPFQLRVPRLSTDSVPLEAVHAP